MRILPIVALALSCAGCANALDGQVEKVHTLKVRDAVNAYEQARASGAPLDRCVKAKLVAIAYEDARDPASASAWRARETEDCQAAIADMGVEVAPRPGS